MAFKLYKDIVEIKTSGYDDSFINLNLLYSANQFKVGIYKGFKFCIQLFVNGYSRLTKLLNVSKCNKCIIAGYVPFEEIKNYPNNKQFYGNDFKIPVNNLINIKELINKYK